MENNILTVKCKLLNKLAKLPIKKHSDDAGYDLTLTRKEKEGNSLRYHFDIAIEIPRGYIGFIFPRSSIYKVRERLSNSVGVIDSNYRGPLSVVFDFLVKDENYKVGDRIAQLIILKDPKATFVEVDDLSETDRGEGGFGSTGR